MCFVFIIVMLDGAFDIFDKLFLIVCVSVWICVIPYRMRVIVDMLDMILLILDWHFLIFHIRDWIFVIFDRIFFICVSLDMSCVLLDRILMIWEWVLAGFGYEFADSGNVWIGFFDSGSDFLYVCDLR